MANSPRRRNASQSPKRSLASSRIKMSPNRLTRSQTKSSPRHKFEALSMERPSLKSRRNLFGSPKKRGRPSSKSIQKMDSPKKPKSANSTPTKVKLESSPRRRSILSSSNPNIQTDTPNKRRSGRLSNSDKSKSLPNSPADKLNRHSNKFIDFDDSENLPKTPSQRSLDENAQSPRKRGRPRSKTPLISPGKKSLLRELQNLRNSSDEESPRKRGRPRSKTSLLRELQNLRNSSDDESPRKLRRSSRLSEYSSSSTQKRHQNKSDSSFNDEESFLSFEDDDSLDDSLVEHLNELKLEQEAGEDIDQSKLSKFTTWTLPNQNSDYVEFMRAVHNEIFHMEHVERALNQSLHKVLNGKEGVILTIYGRAGSGKRTIIDRVFKTRDNIEFVELDGKFTSLQEVKAELKNVYDISKEQKTLVFVMYNFDALRISFANKVLYSLTNHLRKHPFLLLLVTEKDGAVDALEKRIVSRVGQSSIKCIDRRLSPRECWELVRKLVEVGLEKCNPLVKKSFKFPTKIPDHFDRLCYSLPNYGELKSFVKKLADEVFELLGAKKNIDVNSICIRLLEPIDDLALRLRGITDRMYGLMIAAAIVTQHITKWIPFVSIIREYKRFINVRQIKSRGLCVENDQNFLEDAEYLIFQRFWVAKRENESIMAISWMEDPLKLIREEYRSIFMTELAHLVKDELKDESRLY